MTSSEILTSIQTQLAINYPLVNNAEATTFYNDLISEMPSSELIASFVICIDTNQGKGQHPDSNITIITFEKEMDEQRQEILDYLFNKLESDDSMHGWEFLSNGYTLILDLDF